MPRRLLVTLVLCGVAAFIVQPTFAQTTPNIVGTWQLSLVPNTPPSPPVIDIAGLATFHTDFTVEATGGGVVVGPIPVAGGTVNGPTPALGYWSNGPLPGGSLFVLQFTSLITNPNGSLYATRKFTATVTVNSSNDQFAGNYGVTILDTSNNVISTGSGTISGTLIPRLLPPA